MTTFLVIVNVMALVLLMFSCIIRLNMLKGAENPIESIALILFSFAALGQLIHYMETPLQLDVIDVIFNASLSVLSVVITERSWRHYFFNRRQVSLPVGEERRIS